MKMNRFLFLGALMVASAWAAEEPVADPSVVIRSEYEKVWASDQRTLEDKIQSIHARFVNNLIRVQDNARDRGDLDEALAARTLADAVAPLATSAVFRAGGGLQQVYELPIAPTGGQYTSAGYTTYVAKIQAVMTEYNEAASNRLEQYANTLDQLVKEETRRDQLDVAVKIRQEREARLSAGAPCITLLDRTPRVEAPENGQHAAMGTWNMPDGGTRVFKSDRSAEHWDREGKLVKTGRINLISTNVIDVRWQSHLLERCTVLPNGEMHVAFRRAGGEKGDYRMRRADTGAESVDAKPKEVVLSQPEPARQSGIEGRWVFEGDNFFARVFQPDGNAVYLDAKGKPAKTSAYFKLDETEVEVAADDGWVDTYRLQPDGTMVLHAVHAEKGKIDRKGRRDPKP